MNRSEISVVQRLRLEPAFLVSKNQKLAVVIDIIKKHSLDRVVVTSKDKSIGVVTTRDIFSKLSSKRIKGITPGSISVAAFASQTLISTHPREMIIDVARRMLEKGVSSVPVLGDDGVVQGAVSKFLLIPIMTHSTGLLAKDVLLPVVASTAPRAKMAHILERIRKTPTRDIIVIEAGKPLAVVGEKEIALALFAKLELDRVRHFDSVFERMLVLDVMKRISTKLEGSETAKEVAELMHREKVNTLPVYSKDIVSGVVTRDLIFERLVALETQGGN